MGLFLMFLLAVLVSSSVAQEGEELTCTTINESPLIVGTPSDECTGILDQFAAACGEFISCALNYSKPMCFCEACSEEHATVRELYDNITNNQNKTRGKRCKDMLLSDDGVGVVQKSHNLVDSLWRSANCQCEV